MGSYVGRRISPSIGSVEVGHCGALGCGMLPPEFGSLVGPCRVQCPRLTASELVELPVTLQQQSRIVRVAAANGGLRGG